MASPAFVAGDFKVFDVHGFKQRMTEIKSRVRPKLNAFGDSLTPSVGRSVGGPVFAHVAQHARRTVNAPDDTWVAFGPEARGYKKHSHFKIAVSRSSVRFLFEVGPEHADKRRWASAWKKNAPKVSVSSVSRPTSLDGASSTNNPLPSLWNKLSISFEKFPTSRCSRPLPS